MLLEAESRKMNPGPKHFSPRQDTDAPDAVNLHFHIRIAVGITKISKMWSPSRIFRVALNYNGIFIQRVCQCKRCLRLLPRIQVVGLFAAKPVGQRPPDIYNTVRRRELDKGQEGPRVVMTWRTRNNDILVVPHEILKNCKRSGLNVDIAPVYPGVIGA